MKKIKVKPIDGWILIAPDSDDNGKRIPGGWYVCWDGTFSTKKSALAFVKTNDWLGPYRAVRGKLGAIHAKAGEKT